MSMLMPQFEGLKGAFFPETQPIAGDIVFHRGSLTVDGLDEQLSEVRDGLVLQARLFHDLNLDEYLLRSTSFRIVPEWKIGREDSAQEVEFGVLGITVDDGTEAEIPVAIKPYKQFDRDRAINEYSAFETFKEHDYLRSFSPIGFWVDSEGYVSLLTYFEEEVVSLDNVEWNVSAEDPLKDHFSVLAALHQASKQLAWMHASGFAHRDAQLKNLAIDRRTQEVRLTDLTTMRVIAPDHASASDWRAGIANDLRTVVGSVMRAGYVYDDDYQNRREAVDESLIRPYRSMLVHPCMRVHITPAQQDDVREITEDVLGNV